MTELIILFIILGWVSTMLKSGGRTGGRTTPMPPEHLRPKEKKCICNDISKHSPGGICEADHLILKRPEFPKDRIV
jgi:hypothetical protein